jgi:hypothetical protein
MPVGAGELGSCGSGRWRWRWRWRFFNFFVARWIRGGANVHCGPHTEPLGLLVFVPGSLVGVKDIDFVGRPEAETP